MAMPQFTMRELLEAGVHFGHRTHRWNPKMKPYIYGSRNGIHVLDLQQTVPMLYQALAAVRNVAASGGRVLFVGSKPQAQAIAKETAERCGQYYVNYRWLGGTLTNWKTINASIKRLKELEAMVTKQQKAAEQAAEAGAEAAKSTDHLTKKEKLMLEREYTKLERCLGGIKNMNGLPDIIFIIDTNCEKIAIAEANRMGIPIVAALDSNCDPAGITYPFPGNDDAARALRTYCRLLSDAVLDGISVHLAKVESRGESDMPAMRQERGGQGTTVKLSPRAAAAAHAADKDEAEEELKLKSSSDSDVPARGNKAALKAAASAS